MRRMKNMSPVSGSYSEAFGFHLGHPGSIPGEYYEGGCPQLFLLSMKKRKTKKEKRRRNTFLVKHILIWKGFFYRNNYYFTLHTWLAIKRSFPRWKITWMARKQLIRICKVRNITGLPNAPKRSWNDFFRNDFFTLNTRLPTERSFPKWNKYLDGKEIIYCNLQN